VSEGEIDDRASADWQKPDRYQMGLTFREQVGDRDAAEESERGVAGIFVGVLHAGWDEDDVAGFDRVVGVADEHTALTLDDEVFVFVGMVVVGRVATGGDFDHAQGVDGGAIDVFIDEAADGYARGFGAKFRGGNVGVVTGFVGHWVSFFSVAGWVGLSI